MEFRFRPEDAEASSTYFPPPQFRFSPSQSTSNYFSQQAFSAGYFSNGMGRPEFMTNPNLDPVRESIRREFEKEQIRKEIIAEEIIRRQVLEAEVRRELAMEQNLGFSFGPTSLHYHPLDTNNNRVQERVSLSSHTETDDDLPFQRDPIAAKLAAAKPRNTTFTGIKRKVAAIGVSELSLGSSKKKPQKEWSCALCKVTATSEQGLDCHLQGRKHKSREAAMMRENIEARKENEIANSDKQEPIEIIISSNSKPKHEKKPGQANKENDEAEFQETQATDVQSRNYPLEGKKHGSEEESRDNKSPNKDIDSSVTLPSTSEIPDVSKISNSKSKKRLGKRKNSDAGVQWKQITEDAKKKFQFWCEDCQVGCPNEKVMSIHQRGKKHMAKIQVPNQDVDNVKRLSIKNEEPETQKKQKMEQDCKKIFKFRCDYCEVSCPNAKVMSDHERGKKHLAMLQRAKQDGLDIKPLMTEIEEPMGQEKHISEDAKKRYRFWCDQCQVGCGNEKVKADHEKGKKHMARLRATNRTTEAAIGKEVEEANEENATNCDGGEELPNKVLEMKAIVEEANEEKATNCDGGEEQPNEGVLEMKVIVEEANEEKGTNCDGGEEPPNKESEVKAEVEEANEKNGTNCDGGEEPSNEVLEMKATVDEVVKTEVEDGQKNEPSGQQIEKIMNLENFDGQE